jgi:hypothetical protein
VCVCVCVCIRLRAATDVVLETTLPQILTVDSRERSGAISSNPLPINSANVASAKILFEGNGDFLMVDTTLYCNRPRAAGDERPVTPVTQERCDMHEQGTMGTISQRMQYKTLKSRYFSLYACKMVDSQPVCECKDFWRVKECEHSLLWQGLRGEANLTFLGSAIPKNQKKGRKRTATKGLVRQNE